MKSRQRTKVRWLPVGPASPSRKDPVFHILGRSILAVMLVFLCSACVRVDTGVNAPTFGQQIIDLVDARENGLIDETEYQLLRDKLIRSFGR